MHLHPYSSKTVRKLHKIIQKRGVFFGSIPSSKSEGLPSVDGHRMPHILLDIVFPTDHMPLAKVDICANENLY